MMSMKRRIAGLKPSEIRSLGFKEAVEKCIKSVSSEDLEKYKAWIKKFGST